MSRQTAIYLGLHRKLERPHTIGLLILDNLHWQRCEIEYLSKEIVTEDHTHLKTVSKSPTFCFGLAIHSHINYLLADMGNPT